MNLVKKKLYKPKRLFALIVSYWKLIAYGITVAMNISTVVTCGLVPKSVILILFLRIIK